MWIVSAVLDPPARYWVWALALAIDFATPWIGTKHAIRFPPDASHYPERFGLFTIILFGEFVGMAFAFILRWWYFDVAHGADERHPRSQWQARWFDVWQYAHLPLFLGVAIAGVGFERTISHESEGWILSAAVGTSTAALAWIGATRHRIDHRLSAQLGLSMGTIGVGSVPAMPSSFHR